MIWIRIKKQYRDKKIKVKDHDFKKSAYHSTNNKTAKGQLNSKWIYEVILFPKYQPKITEISALGVFLEGRAEISVIFDDILGETMTS